MSASHPPACDLGPPPPIRCDGCGAAWTPAALFIATPGPAYVCAACLRGAVPVGTSGGAANAAPLPCQFGVREAHGHRETHGPAAVRLGAVAVCEGCRQRMAAILDAVGGRVSGR